MSGIGKFPFVNLSNDKLDFESLIVGKTLTKTVVLRNFSQVKAKFKVEQINDDGKDQSFQLSSKSGIIKPGGAHEISITYAPTIVGMYTNAQYMIRTLGGNELKLQFMG